MFTIASKNSARSRFAQWPRRRQLAPAPAPFQSAARRCEYSLRPRQGKCHSPRRSSSAQNQDAATCKRQRRSNARNTPYIIGIVSIQFSTAAHYHRIHRANLRCEGIAIIQIPQNRFLVRQSHAKSRNPQRPDRREKIPQIAHQHRHINRIHTPRPKPSILQSAAKANAQSDRRSPRKLASAASTAPHDKESSSPQARSAPARWLRQQAHKPKPIRHAVTRSARPRRLHRPSAQPRRGVSPAPSATRAIASCNPRACAAILMASPPTRASLALTRRKSAEASAENHETKPTREPRAAIHEIPRAKFSPRSQSPNPATRIQPPQPRAKSQSSRATLPRNFPPASTRRQVAISVTRDPVPNLRRFASIHRIIRSISASPRSQSSRNSTVRASRKASRSPRRISAAVRPSHHRANSPVRETIPPSQPAPYP